MLSTMKQFKKYAVIVAVILIPLVYSFFYLDAFWDPYSKLQDLPVAVVNEDQGADINGTPKNLGKEIADHLQSDRNLKWVITNHNDAKDGVENRRYYAEIVIPKDFSSNIASADKDSKTQGVVVYEPNEKRNFLAGQVLNRVMLEVKDNISKDITKEIVSNMVVEVRKMPEDLKELEDGLGKIADGAKTLQSGIGELKDNQKLFNDGLGALNNGFSDAKAGAQKLEGGSKTIAGGLQEFYSKLSAGSTQIQQLIQGSHQFNAGLQTLDGGMKQFGTGISAVKGGAGELSKGTAEYTANMKAFDSGLNLFLDSVGKSAQANKNVADYMTAYVKAHPEAMNDQNIQGILSIYKQSQGSAEQLQNSTQKLKSSSAALLQGAQKLEEGSRKVAAGTDLLEQNSQKLTQGSAQLAQSYGQIQQGVQSVSGSMVTAAQNAGLLASGAGELNNGLTALNQGIDKLAAGSSELNANAGKFMDGEQKLYEGAGDLQKGANDAHQGVADAIVKANNEMGKLNGMDEFAAQPVKLKEDKLNPVPDYGTGFAPYFMSLSLWVGALMMFFGIYMDPKVRFKFETNSYGFENYLRYSLLGVVQAIVLGYVLQTGLHLQVKNTAIYYLTCIIISLSFVTVMQFLIVNLKDIGKFLAIIILILQLTSCGGTFPMELVPKFFTVLNPFMPMTYSVNALKEVISGIDYSYLYKNLLVLAVVGGVFLTGSLILLGRKTAKEDVQSQEGVNLAN